MEFSQHWIYFGAAPFFIGLIAVVWFFIVRTPMRHMISVTICYRLIRCVDWLAYIGRGNARLVVTVKHSYEELFDTMLVVRALNQHYEDEAGLKWTDLLAEEGAKVSRDLAGLFLSYPAEALRMVSLHLYENRFSLNADPDEIYDFMLEEQLLMAENPDESLDHPCRLWRRFGRGAIYGWRTSLYFAKRS